MSYKKTCLSWIVAIICSSSAYCQDSISVSLWDKGAPGFENRKEIPEQAKDWWVRSVNNPSLTIFKPLKGRANGTAVVICPGGGHRNLVFNAEGAEAARFLNTLGITCFVLKYRLFREENSPYSAENAKEDIFRAMRFVRGNAAKFNIDTRRIGVMGFSAGGEMAGWVAYHFEENHYNNPDQIDLISARPDFQVLIYPGPLAVPDKVSAEAPSTFLLAANDDECCSEPVVKLLQLHRLAKVPVEVHLYREGNHAFNMGTRSKLISIHLWTQRLADWLKDGGLMPEKK